MSLLSPVRYSASDSVPAREDAAALVPLAAGVERVVELQQAIQNDAGDDAHGGDADQRDQAGDADLLVAGHAAAAVGADDAVGSALEPGHQAASLAAFLTLATARSRFSRDRWSMNSTPSRWSISCWMQTA